MPSFKLPISVEMEDGSRWVTVADQRDLAAYEIQPFYSDNRPHTQLRFWAWSASRRAGQTALTWDLFNASCVETDSSVEAEAVGPTRPDQPAGS